MRKNLKYSVLPDILARHNKNFVFFIQRNNAGNAGFDALEADCFCGPKN